MTSDTAIALLARLETAEAAVLAALDYAIRDGDRAILRQLQDAALLLRLTGADCRRVIDREAGLP